MTTHLMQLDSSGQESITSIFMSDDERGFMTWITELEVAAPGCTIFVHKMSDAGYSLCTVPLPYSALADDPTTEKRFCGCPTCIDQRNFLKDYTARIVIPDMEKLFEGLEHVIYRINNPEEEKIPRPEPDGDRPDQLHV